MHEPSKICHNNRNYKNILNTEVKSTVTTEKSKRGPNNVLGEAGKKGLANSQRNSSNQNNQKEKSEESVCDIIKQIIFALSGLHTERGIILFEEIMAVNFPNLEKEAGI